MNRRPVSLLALALVLVGSSAAPALGQEAAPAPENEVALVGRYPGLAARAQKNEYSVSALCLTSDGRAFREVVRDDEATRSFGTWKREGDVVVCDYFGQESVERWEVVDDATLRFREKDRRGKPIAYVLTREPGSSRTVDERYPLIEDDALDEVLAGVWELPLGRYVGELCLLPDGRALWHVTDDLGRPHGGIQAARLSIGTFTREASKIVIDWLDGSRVEIVFAYARDRLLMRLTDARKEEHRIWSKRLGDRKRAEGIYPKRDADALAKALAETSWCSWMEDEGLILREDGTYLDFNRTLIVEAGRYRIEGDDVLELVLEPGAEDPDRAPRRFRAAIARTSAPKPYRRSFDLLYLAGEEEIDGWRVRHLEKNGYRLPLGEHVEALHRYRPPEDLARDAVEAFLAATRDGDADALAKVVPESAKIPKPALFDGEVPGDLSWELLAIDVLGSRAFVRVALRGADGWTAEAELLTRRSSGYRVYEASLGDLPRRRVAAKLAAAGAELAGVIEEARADAVAAKARRHLLLFVETGEASLEDPGGGAPRVVQGEAGSVHRVVATAAGLSEPELVWSAPEGTQLRGGKRLPKSAGYGYPVALQIRIEPDGQLHTTKDRPYRKTFVYYGPGFESIATRGRLTGEDHERLWPKLESTAPSRGDFNVFELVLLVPRVAFCSIDLDPVRRESPLLVYPPPPSAQPADPSSPGD